MFRSDGESVLNLNNPPGVTPEMQELGLNTINKLNRKRFQHLHDPETASRINAYELAFRMQSAVPELTEKLG